jgi:hypothetical protein
MKSIDDHPSQHRPPFHNIHLANNKEMYFKEVLEKFVDEYLVLKRDNRDSRLSTPEQPAVDHVREYSICLLRYFFLLYLFKDAVKVGNGDILAILHKELLAHFKSDSGFNAYAIEMFTNIVQDNVLLSEAQSHTCKWASTANWKGGAGGNIEMDCFQENSNREIKKYIKGMGANKTDKSIERMSRASGGLSSIIDNFDDQIEIKGKSSSHSHKSMANDEKQIIEDLMKLKPFAIVQGREHSSFPNISSDPLSSLDHDAFHKWLKKHKKNLLFYVPNEDENDESNENEL